MDISEQDYYNLCNVFGELSKEFRINCGKRYQSNFDFESLGVSLRVKGCLDDSLYENVFNHQVIDYLNQVCPNAYYVFKTLNIALSMMVPGLGSISVSLLHKAKEQAVVYILDNAGDSNGFEIPQTVNPMWFYYYLQKEIILIERIYRQKSWANDVFVKNPYIFGNESIYFDMSSTVQIRFANRRPM